MRPSATKADDIDIGFLLGALKRNLAKLLLFTGLVGAGTYGVLSLMAPRYVSDTQIAIVPKSTNPFPEGKRDGAQPESITPRVDKEAINTHVRALASTDLLLSVADKLQLAEKAEFNNALGEIDTLSSLMRSIGLGGPRPGQTVQDRVLENVSRQLEVAAARETRYINVRFSSADPQLAANFANTLADSYRAKLVTVPVKETEDVVAALEPKVDQLRREVLDAESTVEVYRAQSDQFKGGAQGTPVMDQRMAALNDDLSKAEAARADADSKWRTARDLAQLDSADVLPEVQKSQLIQSLINQRVRLERQVAEAQASLLSAHPRMRQLNADLAGLRTTIKAEVAKIVQGLEKESRAAAIRTETVTKQINDLKSKVVNTSGNESQLRALESTAKSKRTELEALQKQLENNRTLKATRAVPIEAQIVSAARPSSVPIFPKKGPWTALASIAAFLLGAVTIVTAAMVSGPTPRTSGNGGSMRGRSRPERNAPSFGGMEPVMASAVTASAAEAPKTAKAAAAPESKNSVWSRLGKTAPKAKAAPPQPVAKPEKSVAPAASPAPALDETPLFADAPQPKSPAATQNRQMSWDDIAEGLADADEGSAAVADPVYEIAQRLLDKGGAEPGFRTLLTGENQSIDAAAEAIEIVRVLRSKGRAALLVDWNLDGQGVAKDLDLASRPGLTELLAGKATLSDVTTVIPGTDVSIVACGGALDAETTLDVESITAVLDGLDEHYHHIVVLSSYGDARDLFEAIQGRFDCGITVAERPDPAAQENVFLGFQVADIDLVRHDRQPAHAVAAPRATPRRPSAPMNGAAGEAGPVA